MTTRTIVIYGTTDKNGKSRATFATLKQHADHIRTLRDADDHLLEEFEADCWGHAMSYYQAKYFGTFYKPNDPNVWLAWPDEVASVDEEVLIERSLDLLEHSGLVYRPEPAQTFAVISGIMTKLEEHLEEVAECMQLGDTP